MKRSTNVIVSNLSRDNIIFLFSTFYTSLFLLFRKKTWGGTGPPCPSPCYGTEMASCDEELRWLLQQRWLLACKITEIYEFWEDGFVNKRKFPRFLLALLPEGLHTNESFIRGGSAPRSNPSRFCIPFLTGKVLICVHRPLKNGTPLRCIFN